MSSAKKSPRSRREASLSLPLLAWYRKQKRDLPWRETQDAYRILVSEIMLQQTQVDRVIPFYQKFLKLFPTWSSLAHAQNSEVLRAWSGLGYNRRALVLRDIAKQVVEKGEPKSEEEWRALKGIGAYTAAALTVFTRQARTLPVDTNIRRVLGRVLLGLPYPDARVDGALRARGQELLGTRNAWFDIPQALFDLAAAVCKKKNPACNICPLRETCRARRLFEEGRAGTPAAAISRERIHEGKKFPDRIFRGRILKLVHARPGITEKSAAREADPSFDIKKDQAWMQAIFARLQRDGMIRRIRGRLFVGS